MGGADITCKLYNNSTSLNYLKPGHQSGVAEYAAGKWVLEMMKAPEWPLGCFKCCSHSAAAAGSTKGAALPRYLRTPAAAEDSPASPSTSLARSNVDATTWKV